MNHFLNLSSSPAAVIINMPPYTNINIVIIARIVTNQPSHFLMLIKKYSLGLESSDHGKYKSSAVS